MREKENENEREKERERENLYAAVFSVTHQDRGVNALLLTDGVE